MEKFTYYTPAPEQFIIGFQFEVYVNKVWLPVTYTGQFSKQQILLMTCDGREQIRAKKAYKEQNLADDNRLHIFGRHETQV